MFSAGAGAVGSLTIVFWGFLKMAAFPSFVWVVLRATEWIQR